MKHYVGIDLGGTNIVAGVVNENHEIIARAETKTLCPRPSAEIIDDVAKMVCEAVKNAGLSIDGDDIEWVGVGCPGIANKETGIIEYSCNLDWHDVELKKELECALWKEVFIDNDANAAAFGEVIAGAAMGSKNAVAITLGTGLGGGVIINEQIFAGYNYAGTELGHMGIQYKGRTCGCNRQGCFEAYASATGLINISLDAMLKHQDSAMWTLCKSNIIDPEKKKAQEDALNVFKTLGYKLGDEDEMIKNAKKAIAGPVVNGRTAFDAMRAGDEAGRKVVDEYIGYLGYGVANLINIFQPEILCIGGGISHEGDTLLLPLKEIVDREDYARKSLNRTSLQIAKLGNDAGIIGAAMLGLDANLSKQEAPKGACKCKGGCCSGNKA